MKNYKYIKLLVIVGLLFSAACTKDWLEVKPYGKSDVTTFYIDDNRIQTGVYSIYDFLSSADQLEGWSSNYIMRNLPGDDVNAGGGGSSDQSQYQDIDGFRWTPLNPGIKAFWDIDFGGIYRANTIIDNVKLNSPIALRSIAEAKALRAYYLLEATIAFGDVPIYTHAAKSVSDFAARSPQTDVFNQIIKDFTEAADVLPNKTEYAAADKFRVSKQTCLGYLVKVNVYKKDWAAAIAAFEALAAVEGTQVGLLANFEGIHKGNKFSIESLLEANFITEGKDWSNVQWNRNANDNRHIQLCGPRTGPGGTLGINAGWGFMPPTKKLYDEIDANDPRKINTVLNGADMAKFGASFDDGWQTEGIIRNKLTTFASETGGSVGEVNFHTNWMLLRYADVLLLAAEAYNQSGNDAAARVQINKVRARAGYKAGFAAIPAGTAGSALLNVIKKEREVELAFEGHRFFDLVRWGDAAANCTNFVTGKHEHFPIPQTEINGGKATQNPGY